MSSSVHFRFKSAREFETLSFEGDFLKVADLKVAIVERKKLNFGEGFDLEISDASTGDVYNDESALVQKNTSVIVRRIPGLKQGGILSLQEMAAKNERYAEKQTSRPQQQTTAVQPPNPNLPKAIEGSDEAERIASLVMQSNVQYDQFPPPTRGRYQNRSSFRGRGGGFGGPRNSQGHSSFPTTGQSAAMYPDRAPRPTSNYVCHRCNRPGHWIDQCPTNGDPTYDRIKVRAPTGIPRSMLRHVEAPESGTGLQDSSGQFVTLQPNEEEFARQTVGLRLSQAAAAAGEKLPDDATSTERIATSAISQDTNASPPDTQGEANGSLNPQAAVGQRTDTTKVQSDTKPPVQAINAEMPSTEGSARGVSAENEAGRASIHDPNKRENRLRQPRLGGHVNPHQRRRHQQVPPGVGAPPRFPPQGMPPMPPGMPPIPPGMPPLPPGVPPIPPHILMAMAMANSQNGGPHPPITPNMMPPNIPMPFASSANTESDEKKEGSPGTQDVIRDEAAQRVDTPIETSADSQRGKQDGSPDPGTPESQRDVDDKLSEGRRMDRSGRQQVDRSPSEKIDSEPMSKPHVTRPVPLDRKGRWALNQTSFFENENGLHSEYRGSREPASPPHYGRGRRSRSRSCSLSPQRPARYQREPRDSPRWLEGRPRSPSPRGRGPPKERIGRQPRLDREEEASVRRRSPRDRGRSPPPDDRGRTRHRSFPQRDSLSPLPHERRRINGGISPQRYLRPGRSPERRRRYPSPRGAIWQEEERFRRERPCSPDRKRRRGRSNGRRYRSRSRTPPRNARFGPSDNEDPRRRRYRLSRHPRSVSPLDRINNEMQPDQRGSADMEGRQRDKDEEKVLEKEDAKSTQKETVAGETGGSSKAYERPADSPRRRSPNGRDRTSPLRRGERGDTRRKRDPDRHSRNDRGGSKRARREHDDGQRSVYRHEPRDRLSVHDRLGRPLEYRKRKGQRRSVHDRLG